MTILLLGKNGQVGWELQRALAPLGVVIALGRHSSNGLCGDLAKLDDLRKTIREIKPTIIVNAAAYTAVDRAEEERELARIINAEAPAVLAEEAKARDALLTHYSTDYVFDGSGTRPWQEQDQAMPINHYGATKYAGEQAIQATGCRHLIFRTSWVYATKGNNFLGTMAKLIEERDSLKVVGDQVGAPTGSELIADVTALALRETQKNPEISGIFNLAASGETSWHGYATFIAKWFQRQHVPLRATPDRIQSVPTAAWPTQAVRPLNSRLDSGKLERALGLRLPAWQRGVERSLTERRNFTTPQD
ncbi:dTDP-4-dehydrorhamnose reductase [Alloalcanivorax sp. C16-1]|uniref:dTDP-4-dehydrorhamnose reductase n=1 Tax=Alloalcanivorax sp. C16-1 TaxID=3390051 RepID=UPI003970AFD2